ncbi:Apoptosis-inducing factor [Mycena kentingensis (nom. inval.)]|nr:Apoptosis-inducing factor [Mycena kentingensis (nom. inval.)]
MSAKKNDDRKSVVILDASKYALTLIEARPYRIILPASLRMVVSEADSLGTTSGALVPLDKIFVDGKGELIHDSLQEVDPEQKLLTLDSGRTVQYDILILATGLTWTGPIAFPNAAEEVQEYVKNRREEFTKAQSYVLVGGGAVGCELAGEIKDIFPNKAVTIVHGQHLLLNDTYSERYRRRVATDLAKRGVNLQLGEVATVSDDATSVSTPSGKTISASLVLKTSGASGPNTAFLRTLKFSGALTDAGFVKVRPTLQLVDHPDIFAVGDIVEWAEQKQAFKAQFHAAVVVKNVVALSKNADAKLKNYSTMFEAVFLTNGKHDGSTYLGFLWGLIFGGWVTRMLKSRDLLVGRFRKDAGL